MTATCDGRQSGGPMNKAAGRCHQQGQAVYNRLLHGRVVLYYMRLSFEMATTKRQTRQRCSLFSTFETVSWVSEFSTSEMRKMQIEDLDYWTFGG